MEIKKIFIVAGGTGGHIMPAIAFVENSKNFYFKILTDNRCKRIIENYKINFEIIISSKVSRNFFLLPFRILKIFIGILQSLKIFLKECPDIVIGFGGYTCFPSVISAKLLGIPIILHEQNAVLGRANRFLSIFSKKIALSFEKTKFSPPQKSFYTGLPIRKSFKLISKRKSNSYFKILILGGSQGTSIFSKICPDIFKLLSTKIIKKISVTQQTRNEDLSDLKKCYSSIKIKHNLCVFFNNISDEMKEADLIFSRCGASSLFEIEYLSKFAFIFPLPTAKDNHQYENAIQFSKKNNCMIISEEKINLKKIVMKIENMVLKKNKNKFSTVSKVNPSQNMCKLIESVLKKS